ncbi:MAG TPA: hypothetical protein PKY87_16780 [Terricaulis sp.]|nr:hypothetical protein [Terricaulis sp.]
MQLAHQLGGEDVDGILLAEGALFDTEDEAELLDIRRQRFEREHRVLACFEIEQVEGLKIADEDVARQLSVLDAGEVI